MAQNMIPKRSSNIIEKIFEAILWKSRFIVLLAVIFGLLGAFSLFLIGSYDIWLAISTIDFNNHDNLSSKIISGVIGAIDLYLIGVVTLIFSFGLYELFISKIDIAREDKEVHILEITDLDELKNRILKVIIMVLVVTFFKHALEMEFTTTLEMLYLALGILAMSLSTFFLLRHDTK